MSISYVTGAVANGTAPGNVTCQVGDLILVWAYRDGSNTAPTLDGAFTAIANAGANTNSSRLAYKIATGTTEGCGTWTNATKVIAQVYRTSLIGSGYSLVPGNTAVGSAASTTVNYPALTLQDGSGNAWVAGFAGHRSTDTNVQNAPSGMTNRQTSNNTTAEASGHDTNGGVSSWSSTNVSVSGTSSGWHSYVVEIREAIPVPAGWTVLTSGGGTVDATSFNTASVSPTADALVLCLVTGMGFDTSDRVVPTSVGSFTLVDSEIVGPFTTGSVWRYLNSSPFSGAVTIDFGGANLQDTVSWIIIERTGVDTSGSNGSGAVGTPVSGAATSTAPSPGTITFAGSGAETFVANFWGDPSSASVATHRADVDFHEFQEQTNADTGWYTGVAANVAPDQQTSHVSALSASETWASIGFEVKLASAGAYELVADSGAFTLTGTAAGLTAQRTLAAAAGSYTFTGTAAALQRGYPMVAASGGFTLTGAAAALEADRTLTATSASFALTGQAATISAGKSMVAAAGSYTLTGTAAGLAADRVLAAAAGAYTLAGADVTLTYTPNSGAYELVADSATFVLTGADAALTYTSTRIAQEATGGWGFYLRYEQERERRRRRKREEEEAEEAVLALPPVEREIAQILHKQERRDAKREDIERLKALVVEHTASNLPPRVADAYERAYQRQTISALLNLDRELRRMAEEEENFVLMLLLNG